MYTLVQDLIFIKRCKLKYVYKFEILDFKTFSKSSILAKSLEMATKKSGYYAVRNGRKPGVYNDWAECELQVKGFSGAIYKKFPTLELAKNFLDGNSTSQQLPVNQLKTDLQNKINTLEFAKNLVNQGSTSQRMQLPLNRLNTNLRRKNNVSNSIDSEILGLTDSNFFDDWGFDEGIVPVITSASDMVTSMPKITYSAPKKESYYAVHRGNRPGVYRTWTECSEQIKDCRNPSYRKFDNQKEAEEYVRTGGIKKATKRELRNLEINNKVIKKRRLTGGNQCEYTLKDCNEPVVVFTDGASSENGRRRSKAGIGVYWGDNHPLNTSKRITGRQTNNRAEIFAAVHALHQAKQIRAKKVVLYTDSQFVIHSITDWIKKWKKNGWKLVTGQEVANKEDFIALDSAQTGLDVEWIYVRAHDRNEGNEKADRLAVAGRELVMKPENCSEFQNITTKKSESSIVPFLLTNASTSAEEILPLVRPNILEKKPYYAVHRGKNPGIYSTWTDCERQIKDFLNPSFRRFFSQEEAKEFVRSGKVVPEPITIPFCKEDEYVTVFTDGASASNGSEDARAGIGVYWGPGNELNTSMRLFGRQTNNRAEIYAVIHALKQAKQFGIKNIRVFTDSKFVINGITIWIKDWKEKNWKNAKGKPVTNKDDFIALDNACQGLNIDWCYIKAHDNNPGNDEADKLAVAGCSKPISESIIFA